MTKHYINNINKHMPLTSHEELTNIDAMAQLTSDLTVNDNCTIMVTITE